MQSLRNTYLTSCIVCELFQQNLLRHTSNVAALFVQRAASWSRCGRIWQGMVSAVCQMSASCCPASCLVEEPGWGVYHEVTLNGESDVQLQQLILRTIVLYCAHICQHFCLNFSSQNFTLNASATVLRQFCPCFSAMFLQWLFAETVSCWFCHWNLSCLEQIAVYSFSGCPITSHSFPSLLHLLHIVS